MATRVTVAYVRPRGAPIEESLEAAPQIDVEAAETLADARDRVADGVDAVVCESAFDEGRDGLLAVSALHESDPEVPIFLYTAEADGELAARASRRGATEYVPATLLEADDERLADRVLAAAPDEADGLDFDAVVDPLDEAILTVDETGEIAHVTPAAAALTGYDRGELNGASLATFLPALDGEDVRAALREFLDGDDAGFDGSDLRVRHRDGRTLPVSVSLSEATHGGDRYVTCVLFDGAERERLQANLHDRLSTAFFALDAEFRFTHVNEAAESLLDHAEEELLGIKLWEAFPAATDSVFEAKFREAMSAREQLSFETHFEPIETWFEVRASPSASGLAVSFHDVTDRKRFEETLTLLHEATRELFRAESESAVSRVVARTAADALDLAGVAVYRYDAETDTLYPDAAAGETGFMRGELPAVPPDDDSIVGHTYASDAVEHAADVRESPHLQVDADDTDMRSGLFVPLGDHGVLVVGSQKVGAFSDRTRRLVEVLGANAEAAFDRVEREAVLEKSRRRYRTLVENFPNGAVALFDDEERYRVVGGEIFEFDKSADELVGERVGEVLPDALRAELLPRYRAALAGDADVFEMAHGDDLREIRTAPVRDDDGDVFAGMAISQDVTERKRRERELSRRVRQQEVIAELGELALTGESLDSLMSEASRLVADTLDTDYAKVLDLSAEGGELHLRAGVGWQPGYVGDASVPADSGSQAGFTLENDDPVVVESLEAETRFEGPDLLLEHDVTSGISVVIGSPDDPWGVLGTHDTDRRAFSEHDAKFVQSVANVLMTAISRTEHEYERERQHERLAALNQLHTVVHDINRALARHSTREEIEREVCERLADSESYRFAWVGDADGDEVRARTEAGTENYLSDLALTVDDDSPTARALREGEAQITRNVPENDDYKRWREHAAEYGYRSSAAIPIVHGGERFGVLNVYAERPDAFTGYECDVLEQLGEMIGLALVAIERERELHDREAQYRTLVENFPNGGVTLFDEDLHYTRVGGEFYDEVGVDPSDVVGEHVADHDLVPDSLRPRIVAAHRAAIEGTPIDTEIEFRGRTFRLQTLPVDADGRRARGMSLVWDVSTLKRRERQLEHERERLEFVNHILRHNLLNGLNVVRARANLLDGRVDPEGREHLSTVQDRIDDLVDFVETMRTFMKAVATDESHELEPVALSPVLESEIDKTERAYDEVSVDAELADVTVRADPLLEEIFENLLTNAVTHNDKAVPRVEVRVEPREETVVVEVADNGPGIPPDQQSRVLQKGEKGVASPGTGFGLYLVRETVENYGGEIRIRDDDLGAVVAVELPRADADA